jgi:hypothetical protein
MIKSAIEFLKDYNNHEHGESERCNCRWRDEVAMRQFAKAHVKAALEAAAKNAKIIDDPNSYCGNTGSEYLPDQIVDPESILNSYPLDNIK